MSDERTTALVYADGVIDICQFGAAIDTLRPVDGETTYGCMARAGWEGTQQETTEIDSLGHSNIVPLSEDTGETGRAVVWHVTAV